MHFSCNHDFFCFFCLVNEWAFRAIMTFYFCLSKNELFDVWKPLFVKDCEKLGGGLGITMDDVAAGVLANACLRIIIF